MKRRLSHRQPLSYGGRYGSEVFEGAERKADLQGKEARQNANSPLIYKYKHKVWGEGRRGAQENLRYFWTLGPTRGIKEKSLCKF